MKKGKTLKEGEGGSSPEITPGGEIEAKEQVGEQVDDEAPKGAPKTDIRELKRAEAMPKMKTKIQKERLIGLSAGKILETFIEEPKGAYVQDQVQTGEPKEAKGAQKLDTREPKGAKAMLAEKNPAQQEGSLG